MLADWIAGRGRWIWPAVALAAAGLLLYSVRAVLPPFVLAAVLAYILTPPVEALHRRGLGRGWAILVVYACAGLLIGGIVAFVVPLFVAEMERLSAAIPEYTARIHDGLAALDRRYQRIPLPDGLRNALDMEISRLEAGLTKRINGAVRGVFDLFSGALTLVLAPILAFYLLNDLPRFRRRVQAWLPPGSRPRLWAFLAEADRAVAGFIRGQLTVAACVGVMTAAAMAFLGVRYAVVLGLVAALTDLIPYFGPFLGALPGVALAGMTSFTLAAKAAVAYLVVQQIENTILVPRVIGNSVGLHPVAIVFAILVGGHFWGILGMVAAVPAAALLRVTGAAVLEWVVDAAGRQRSGV